MKGEKDKKSLASSSYALTRFGIEFSLDVSTFDQYFGGVKRIKFSINIFLNSESSKVSEELYVENKEKYKRKKSDLKNPKNVHEHYNSGLKI